MQALFSKALLPSSETFFFKNFSKIFFLITNGFKCTSVHIQITIFGPNKKENHACTLVYLPKWNLNVLASEFESICYKKKYFRKVFE